MFPLRLLLVVALAVRFCAALSASGQPSPRFVAIALGAGSGPSQDDLSAYLLAPSGAAVTPPSFVIGSSRAARHAGSAPRRESA